MLALTDLIRWRAERQADSVALVDDRGDRATYRELWERIERCGRRWQERGVSPGEVVALLDTNSVAFTVNLFGLSRLGAIPALLNWRLTAHEHRALLDLVEPVAIAAGDALIDNLPSDLPPVRVRLGGGTDPTANQDAGPDASPAGGWVRDDEAAGGETALPAPPQADAVFALAFSSGTTGRAKAIPFRHESLARSALVDSLDIEGMYPDARHLVVAPMFHLAGLSNSLMGLASGAELHLRTGFDPDAVLDDIERLQISYMTAVPAMFRALVAAAGGRAETPGTGSVLEMTYGASPIAPELVREIRALFPGTRLRQFYGMTEVAGALTTLHPSDHPTDDPSNELLGDPSDIGVANPHHQSAGQVNPGFEVRLVDREHTDVPDGEPGQILVRGPSVMHGYWRDPAATADAFVDGWFATGDIATRSHGYLTIMDRAKDMIVTGGENVYPAEVEAALYQHPDVADVAVIGVPDDRMGERVHAVVVARAGVELDLASIQTHCRGRLAGYKLPRSLELLDDLPRNATGKILKRQLRAPHWEGQARKV